MKKLFVVSVIFLIVGIGSLGVSLYLYRIYGQRGPAVEMEISGGAAEEEAEPSVVYKKPETMDLSTPDKAIRSYWEHMDYLRSAKREADLKRFMSSLKAFDEYVEVVTPLEQPFLETFLAREALEARLESMRKPWFVDTPNDARRQRLCEYKRVIKGVEFESDSRAKVKCVLYNVTPIEDLFKQPLDEKEKQQRKRGEDFVYTLEKFQDEWKIIGRGSMCTFCEGTGFDVDGRKKCFWCDGDGWNTYDVLRGRSEYESHVIYLGVNHWEN